MTKPMPILMLFDGTCHFCSGSVLFLSRRTPRHLTFCAMQTPTGQRILKRMKLPLDDFETLIVIEEGCVLTKSRAVMRLGALMGRPWAFLTKGLYKIPEKWRDKAYDFIAGHRFAIAGRRRMCLVPPPELRRRFVD